MKKLFTFLLISLFLISFASALQSTEFVRDQDKINKQETTTNYGTYIIEESVWWDVFGWWTTERIKEVTLKDNSDICGENCYAIKEINNLDGGSLIDDIRGAIGQWIAMQAIMGITRAFTSTIAGPQAGGAAFGYTPRLSTGGILPNIKSERALKKELLI